MNHNLTVEDQLTTMKISFPVPINQMMQRPIPGNGTFPWESSKSIM